MLRIRLLTNWVLISSFVLGARAGENDDIISIRGDYLCLISSVFYFWRFCLLALRTAGYNQISDPSTMLSGWFFFDKKDIPFSIHFYSKALQQLLGVPMVQAN